MVACCFLEGLALFTLVLEPVPLDTVMILHPDAGRLCCDPAALPGIEHPFMFDWLLHCVVYAGGGHSAVSQRLMENADSDLVR